MLNVHSYQAEVEWSNGRTGWATFDRLRPLEVSAPREFGGEPGKWTPEHLLVNATASCLMVTFAAIAQMSGLAVLSLRVRGSGKLEKVAGDGARFTEIVLEPVIEVANSDVEKARRLLAKAEKNCFIANSLRAAVRVEPQFVESPVFAMAGP